MKDTLFMTAGVGALLCVMVAAGAASAQTVPAAAPPVAAQTDEVSSLDDIVVTAQKRDQNLQDVGLSVAAFSSETLENAGVSNASELQRVVPNFTALRGASTSNLRLNIRGIGAAGNTAIDQSVAVFLDGVYVARPSALYASFLDIDGVEVVRGPQGTLFGRNTTAGGVILRSTDPKQDFSASFLAEAGDYGSRKAEAIVNLPGTDRLRTRVALVAEQFDGYGLNLSDGSRFGERNSLAGRLGVAVDLTPTFRWIGKVDFSTIDGDGLTAAEAVGSTIGAAQRASLAARLGGVDNLPELGDPTDHRVNQITTGDVSDDQYGLSSRFEWDLPGDYTLRLISGYRDYDNVQFDGDTLYTIRPLVSRTSELASKSHTQELQLISPEGLLNDRLSFVAGLYYSREELGIDEQLNLTTVFCDTFTTGATRLACLAAPLNGATTLGFSQTAESWAVYGQGDYRLTDTLSLQLGGRYTRDDKSGSFVQQVANPVAASIRAPETAILSFEDERPTYRAALNWTPTDDLLVFVSYSTGYKAGGFNSGGGSTALGAVRRTFDSEEATNYEAGVRSQFLDRRVTVNATLYRTEIDQFQDRSFDGNSFTVRNAGTLRHQGLELDTRFVVTDALSLTASAAYLDSAFLDFTGASAYPGCSAASPAIEGCGPVGGVRTVQDLTGKRAHYAPDWQGSVMANWERTLSGGWIVKANGGASYLGEQFVGSVTDNNPQTLQDPFTLWNARLSLVAPDGRWEIALFGENLTDEGYCPNIVYQPSDSLFGVRNPVDGGTLNRCFPGAPRTLGASVKVAF